MMAEFVTYSTNHSRPWMDIVEILKVPEDEAKRLFDRIEPCKSMEERYQAVVKMIGWAQQEALRRARVRGNA